MIIKLIFIITLVMFINILFLFYKKSLKLKNIFKEFQDYKNSIEEEIVLLKNRELKYNILFSQENQKNIELKHSTMERINELKLELKLEKDKIFFYIEEIKNYKLEIAILQTKLKDQNNYFEKKIKLFQSIEDKLKFNLEDLVNKIFENNSTKITQLNQENLSIVLNPIKDQLNSFERQIENIYIKKFSSINTLHDEIKIIKELNNQILKEAYRFTNTIINNNKKQGIWGEIVLENILEKSGLRKDFEYFREKVIIDNHGKIYRPDVIIKLPNNRDIIIDSKTSLFAYNNYISANHNKDIYLKAHIKSIKNHVKNLASKNYENLRGINSLDLIFMFIPIDGALLIALNNDVNLYNEAFKKKIILVSPATLLIALHIVENIWRYKKQAQNISEIYIRAEELYKKFVNFIEDLEKVGKSINEANKFYENAFNKLKNGQGNLIFQVEKLKLISNIKPKKDLDKILVENSMMNN